MQSIRVRSFALSMATAAALVVVTAAQGQAPPQSGIYVEAGAGQAEVRLPGAALEDLKATGMGKSMLTMGLSKPKMKAAISGVKADTRVTGDVTFRFQFAQRGGAATPEMSMADMMAMMGGDGGIPSMVKGPQDIILVKLSVGDERRDVELGTAGGGRPKDAVQFTAERIGAGAFRVKPKEPLAPGEYVFYAHQNGQPMGAAWDFGVDAK